MYFDLRVFKIYFFQQNFFHLFSGFWYQKKKSFHGPGNIMLKQILHTILVPFVFTNEWLISSMNLKFKGGDENFSFWTIHETGGKFAFQLYM